MSAGPPFGQADLTNCEREQIHLAGSVQPHGVLLLLREADRRIEMASANAAALLGRPVEALLGRTPAALEGDLAAQLEAALAIGGDLVEPVPLRCRLPRAGTPCELEGCVHRPPGGGLVLELEPVDADAVALDADALASRLQQAMQRFGDASTIGQLADAAVRCVRDITGYDRVMVYRFDPDGHGQIVAEARDPRLASLLGHHYPATDIPQRARELYLRNRVRVLADVDAPAAPLQPPRRPGDGDAAGGELDMSMCTLRAMSPLHLQYLRNMGVTATLVVSLVREGALWGLIACHHDQPRRLRQPLRAAADLLAELMATRIAAIENYAHAQVAIQVRRLEQRLVDATSTEGDWRLALLRHPRTLLQPLDATGAALCYEDELLTAGEVPSTPQLRALLQWVESQPRDGAVFDCRSVERANPAFAALTPTASGVLGVRLSADRADWLLWLRKEQLLSVTWAGDPAKPMVANDPLELSPRRSFAAWSEIVRGTAVPWSGAELALGRAIGAALADIIVQVNAVRLLIAEQQLAQLRVTVAAAKGAVLVLDDRGRRLFANEALARLLCGGAAPPADLDALAAAFGEPAPLRAALAAALADGRSWRGEATLADAQATPLALRAEIVPARDGGTLGMILMADDLSETRRALQARQQLERALREVRSAAPDGDDPALAGDPLIAAIRTHAGLAAMDIADGEVQRGIAPLLQELEASTRRAALLYGRIRAAS